MKNQFGRLTASAIAFFSLLPAMAFAGTASPSVMLGAGGLATTPVPALSDGLLIALGLLLAVIALRTIRQKVVYQKILSFTLLACGLVVGGMGVERSVATTATPIMEESNLCGGGTANISFTRGISNPTMVQNSCETTVLEVLGYTGLPCAEQDQVVTNAGIGDTFGPGETVSLNHCPAVQN